MNMEIKCEYRNCGCDISNMRPNAKYCSRKCKTNEGKYERRRKQFIDKCKEKEMKEVELIKYIKKIITN